VGILRQRSAGRYARTFSCDPVLAMLDLPTGIGRSTIDRILAAAAAGGAINKSSGVWPSAEGGVQRIIRSACPQLPQFGLEHVDEPAAVFALERDEIELTDALRQFRTFLQRPQTYQP
jgi:hypothetical protein